MRFPNAAKGIPKIFTAEILALIAGLATGVLVIFAAVFSANEAEEFNTAMGVSGIGMAVCGIGAAVLMLISLIFKIIGVIQSAKDDASFRLIIYLAIVNIVISIVAAFFPSDPFITNMINGFSSVISFICSLLIVLGIGSMAAQLGNLPIVAKCGTIFKVILGIGVVSLLARFFGIFLPSQAALIFVVSLAIFSMILEIVQYILYLSLLSQAKKMLAAS